MLIQIYRRKQRDFLPIVSQHASVLRICDRIWCFRVLYIRALTLPRDLNGILKVNC